MGDLLNLNRLIYFSTVIEAGSFTAAGDRLGVAKAVVSHQVAMLERELGVTLMTRTTRRLHATEEGLLFYQRCTEILREAESAYAEVSQHTVEPSGVLTVTAPLDYGSAVLAPTIAAYLASYPHMRVDIVFDDQINDMVADRLDLSIRVGWLIDSSHPARRLGSFRQLLVGTPDLARRLGEDAAPATVEALPWIANGALKNPLRWTFVRDGSTVNIEANSVAKTDKTPTAHACALSGIGVGVFPDFLVEPDIKAGKLVHLLPQWTLPEGGIHAVFPVARYRPAKVRIFLDMLIAAERNRSRGRRAGG